MSKTMPDLRFKLFEKAYKTVPLSEVVDKLKSYSLSRDVETAEVTGYKYIHYGDIHTKKASLIDDSNILPNIVAKDYISLQKDDLVLADASEDYQGIATPALILNTPKQKIIAGLHTIALRPKNNYSSIYIYYLLQSQSFKKFGYKTGTGMKVFGINYPNLIKFKNLYPSFEEQQKIGRFFKQLDDTIATQQKLVEQQQQYKEAMLQKMFPQKGERVPKLRFEGFTGDWEIRKFKDFISKAGKKNSSGKDYISYSVNNKLGLVRQGEQFEGSRLDNLDKTAYKLVNPNEFAYNPARINVGSIGFNNLGSTVIVSSLYVVLKMSGEINNEYILQFIKSKNFIKEVKKNTEGSVREYLFYENFKNIKFPYAPNYKEQQKIGSFFKQLDDTIALHQKKLEDYQQLKKVLLKRMFV
ncbi:restriction endonuclease subunit S [Bacillus sp. FSL K6-1145]|uniref:restriction endonuclease subunit S n=1 Tax=Bacillus sp. FSL K6-1145 TaxID=2921464 RepID=UPI0030FBBD75